MIDEAFKNSAISTPTDSEGKETRLGQQWHHKKSSAQRVGWVGVSLRSCSKSIKRDATTNMWGSLSSPDCLHPLLVPQHALNPNLGHYIQSQPDSRNKWVLAEKEIPSYYKLRPQCFGGIYTAYMIFTLLTFCRITI